ncbi:sugar ABC transporter substrate-binding protein [Virgisporangium aliadipatigenens]|uniref:Sugar ABC transporter substrate-binding protein n=1 Tax=Virgisporangium aliadipatigenens TaxID=741659 RepID=A0A8J3YIK9_9ACTN|nr:extracellular solute-binding protein [Virgisporangium aliadipatigenens]GIJ45092.1 sugar ABC transporter substrate-binding protein [Virgisporangium aliadipatigenens]
MFTRTRTVAVAVALALAAVGLVGCGDDDSGDDAKTLKLWHYESENSAMGIAWAKAIEQFKASHPGVEVVFEAKSFEQIRQSANMILNSKDAPDIMEYNKGNASAGLLSKQGLLTDLSDEADKRGWSRSLNAGLATTAKYDKRGVMGGDRWFGVPNYAEYVEVYYNKDLFAKHNVAVPTTLEQFTAAMDTFKAAGVTPLAMGGAEYPAHQLMYQLALTKADRSWVEDYQLYKKPVDFKGPQWTYGATTFADWVAKGYVDKNTTGLKAEDMGLSFIQGKAPIMVSGSWWYGRLVKEASGFQWGTFLFPGTKLHLGSAGNMWVVPAKAKAKKLAYDFIDITLKPEIQNLLGNSGGIPVAADAAAITDPKSKELIANYAAIGDGFAFYPDWPAPAYYDVLVAGTQKLMNGTATPAQVLDEIAKPYDEAAKNVGK